MGRMSSRERMERMALEAELTAKEKAEQPAKPKAKATRKAAAPATGDRVKMVWKVLNASEKEVAVFPYPQKAEAEAKAEALTEKSGKAHRVKSAKVPFDQEI